MMTTSCPICQRAMDGRTRAEWPQWPFCSARCKQIDFGRWLGEAYRIPAEDQDGPSEAVDQEIP